MKNIDIFKTSDFILNNPLYTLLLVTLFYLFFYSRFGILDVIKHKLNIQRKNIKFYSF